MAIKRCRRCGRPLRSEQSLKRGLGDACFKILIKARGKSAPKKKRKLLFAPCSSKPLKKAKEIPPFFEEEYFSQNKIEINYSVKVNENSFYETTITQISFFDNI